MSNSLSSRKNNKVFWRVINITYLTIKLRCEHIVFSIDWTLFAHRSLFSYSFYLCWVIKEGQTKCLLLWNWTIRRDKRNFRSVSADRTNLAPAWYKTGRCLDQDMTSAVPSVPTGQWSISWRMHMSDRLWLIRNYFQRLFSEK